MQKNTWSIIVIIALFIGIGIGYQMGTGKSETFVMNGRAENGHMMSDGRMMNGSGEMSMSEMMTAMNAQLKGKTGDDFDKAFISEMIVHHQGAVEMAQYALTNAKHQEIKDLAVAIVSAQNKEISDMKAWQKAWYGQ